MAGAPETTAFDLANLDRRTFDATVKCPRGRHRQAALRTPFSRILHPEETMAVVTILGIAAFYHDSAAAVIRDGEIIAAASEERFTRRKGDARFPANAVAYCLREARIRTEALTAVGFYEKPLLKFE